MSEAPPMLCLGDFAALDATGADPDPLGVPVDQRLHSLKIDAPAAAGHVVRVRDVIAKLRTFAANVAYLCHDVAPNLCVSVPPGPAALRQLKCRLYWACPPGRPSGLSNTHHPRGLPNS